MSIDHKVYSKKDSLFALSNLLKHSDSFILNQVTQSEHLIKELVNCMKSEKNEESVPSINAICFLLSHDDQQVVDRILKHSILEAISIVLKNQDSESNIKVSLWGLSNVAAGSETQIQKLFANNELVE